MVGEVRRLERRAGHLLSPLLIGKEPFSEDGDKTNQVSEEGRKINP